MKKPLSIFLLICLTFQPGCASIVGGKRQTVRVESNPVGATVKTNREDVEGITPTSLVLSRKHEYQLIIEKKGYKTRKVFVDQDLRGWFWMNILSWGLIGIIVDLAPGSAYEHEPETVIVTLEEE